MTHAVTGTIAELPDRIGRGAVRVESRYRTDAADLWTAVTDPERLARWIADVSGELSLGGAFQARFTSGWEGAGRVDVCDAPRRLVLTMEPGTDDETVIEAQLHADGAETRLVVEERGIAVPELPAHGAGWQTHLEDLGAYLAGQPTSDWGARARELHPSYQR